MNTQDTIAVELERREALEERDHCECGAALDEDDPHPLCWDCRPLNQFERRSFGSEVG